MVGVVAGTTGQIPTSKLRLQPVHRIVAFVVVNVVGFTKQMSEYMEVADVLVRGDEERQAPFSGKTWNLILLSTEY